MVDAVASPPAWRNAARAVDVHAWAALAALPGGYLPWSSGAIRPSALVLLLNDALVLGRETIVECGGGVSTLYFARLLAQRGGGRVVTLEHDPLWAAFLTAALAREGLADRVALVYAPLDPSTGWYRKSEVADALAAAPIDLLLVDGPPAHEPGSELARHPALPTFLPALAEDATIALDDLPRPGEREVLARWERETDLRFERFDEQGLALARTGGEPLRP